MEYPWKTTRDRLRQSWLRVVKMLVVSWPYNLNRDAGQMLEKEKKENLDLSVVINKPEKCLFSCKALQN